MRHVVMWHCHWRMILKVVPQNELNGSPVDRQLSPLRCIFYLGQIRNVTDLRSVVWSWVGTSCFKEVWWIGLCTLPQEQTYLSTDSSLQDNVPMWQWWFLNKPHCDSVNRNPDLVSYHCVCAFYCWSTRRNYLFFSCILVHYRNENALWSLLGIFTHQRLTVQPENPWLGAHLLPRQ